MKPDPCPKCGANRNLVGYRHNCVPAAPALASAEHLANQTSNDTRLANTLANTSAKAPGRNRTSPTYRYRNPTKRRLYMRDLMRRKRAAERTVKAA